MSTLSDAIEKFCLQNSTQPDDALKAVFRDTWVNVMYPQMITNELQGQLLSMISLLARPLQILEIGTFTGYATICLASGLTEGGKITTIEKNAELENRIRRNIETALLTDKTELLIGDAKEIIQQRFSEKAVSFDIIYIDADKENYPVYLSLAYPLLKPGGVMLADNVFWGGKMFDENTKPTKESLGVKKFLSAAAALPWQSRTIIPVGDGLFFGIMPKGNIQ
ncbi:MAG TPA: O-methyltransferase [Bacteroidales bacterium]|nr:O-methyltransferase [Bacteroidales bacterium]